MEFFRIQRDIPFMRYAPIFNVISIITFLFAVGLLVFKGLNLSVEFTGGTVTEVTFPQAADLEASRKVIEGLGFAEAQVQNFGTSRDVMIRLPLREGITADQQASQIVGALKSVDPGVELRRNEFVGPQVGAELATDGALALLMVIVGIMIYLAVRFEWKFALSAIVANLHDVVIILGFFALFQWEFSLSVLAAVLAVLGYSVNESVIVFDRVREKFRERRARTMTTPQVLDHAITSTISRTIMTHGSTQIMVLSMFFFGGPTLHGFSLALTIGIWFGIFSSIFVGAAIVMWLGLKREDLIKPVRKKDGTEVELP